MRRLAGILAVLLALGAGQAHADQNDPRLDGLFEDLRAAPDFAAGREIENQIWRIWLEPPDNRTREAVLLGMAFLQDGNADLADLSFNEAIQRPPAFAETRNNPATFRFL